ncbi:hypothetical protein ACJMK2_009575 [Sinanodonta woodiana]|uniref:Transporter n=1 Tax=Sinanodonta woodiana TaxID=1069815 RepID=A0ABD3VCY5_SINWO
MSDKESILELQPFDSLSVDTGSNQMNHIRKEFSNGVILKNGSETPPGFPPSDNNADGNHSLLPDQSDDLEKGSNASSHKDRPIREDWGHKADFLLAVIGYAVDLSNVWRFPYLCYRNGGGAFIIPYFTVLILGALPIFFMEMSLGQFHREGPVTVWKIVPICKGIGYASCFMAYIVAFYYNVVIGWSFFYLFSSFTLNLPWGGCNNSWNTENCWSLSQGKVNVTANQSNYVSSTFEYFERGMLHLHLSKGVDDLGSPQWQLVLCTLLTFTVLYFSLWKGVKSSGKLLVGRCFFPGVIRVLLPPLLLAAMYILYFHKNYSRSRDSSLLNYMPLTSYKNIHKVNFINLFDSACPVIFQECTVVVYPCRIGINVQNTAQTDAPGFKYRTLFRHRQFKIPSFGVPVVWLTSIIFKIIFGCLGVSWGVLGRPGVSWGKDRGPLKLLCHDQYQCKRMTLLYWIKL